MEKQFEQYSDKEIIQRINDGEIKLYEVLIRRYNSFIYRIGRTYKYNHQDTEDLMQETYIAAFRHLRQFENRSAFKTWLIRIMLNQCYQKKHRLRDTKEILTDDLPIYNTNKMQTASNNETIAVNRELGRILEDAIQAIPEDYRLVFALRELNGFNVSETADLLHITESNVKTRLSRAKQMLRTRIEKMYSPQEIFAFNLIYCDGMVDRVMQKINEIKHEI